jgi:hypothetical protein
VNSLALAPNGDILVGTINGTIFRSTDAGMTYTQMGVGLTGATAVMVAADANYATNGIIYAGDASGTVVGVWRLAITTTTTTLSLWTQLDADAVTAGIQPATVVGMVVSPDGTLYVADSSPAGATSGGIVRTVYPTDGDPGVDTIFGTADDPTGTAPPTWEWVSIGDGLVTNDTLQNLKYTAGSNILLAIESTGVDAVVMFTDTLAIAVDDLLRSPKDGFKLTWDDMSMRLTYEAISPAMSGYGAPGPFDPSDCAILKWRAVEGATAYNVFVNTAANPTSTATGVMVIAVSTEMAIVWGLQPGTEYHWRVQAKTPVLSRFNASWEFTSGLTSVTQPTTLYLPLNGATGVSITPTFSWPEISMALRYDFELADNPLFATPLVSKTGVLAPTSAVYTLETELDYSTTYYWRVRNANATTTSAWVTASFTTMAEPEEPPPPVVVEPTPPAPPAPILELPTQETPAYIWAIVGIGAVLLIFMLVLIWRTRRV